MNRIKALLQIFKMKVDGKPAYAVCASAGIGLLVWLSATLIPGDHGPAPPILGLITAGVSVYFLLFTTGALGEMVGAGLFAALWGGAFGMIIGAGCFGDFIVGVFGLFAGAMFAFVMTSLIYEFLRAGKTVDQERLKADSLLIDAKRAHREKEYEKQIDYLNQLLETERDSCPERTAFTIGQTLEKHTHDHPKAIYWYRKSIAFAYKRGGVKDNVFARESQQAINSLEALERGKPGSAVEGLIEAKKLIEKKLYEQAERKLLDLERLFPNNPEINYLWGHSYLRQNNTGMGIEHFERALHKDPMHLLASYFKAKTKQESKLLYDAKEDFLKYIHRAQGDELEKERVADAKERLSQIEFELEHRFDLEEG